MIILYKLHCNIILILHQQVQKTMIKVSEMLAPKLIYIIWLLNVAYLIDFSDCFVTEGNR